ncbi:MAG: hypothetical protein COA96_13060 [SAR86 cluster bacterium]|uniref:Uncharacterized protein n=1 Tax=SAR86 cluster bacterium TaxID=2030880 RepID=A0A2A5AUI5_9GAMM|nr:MAG: hypothetical protein COA96_13060 [SAR86 cluster bacterium]
MNFDDDILLGDGLDEDEAAYQIERGFSSAVAGSSSDRINLKTGLVVSVFLHIAIASVFFSLAIGASQLSTDSSVASIQIRMVPSNPLIPVIDDELVLEDKAEPIVEPEVLKADSTVIEPEQSVAESTELLEPMVTEPNAPIRPLVEQIQIPTVLAVQQSLDAINSERASKFYSYECNAIERKEGIRECEPESKNNFSVLERNSTYELYNSRRERSRSQATVTTFAKESGGVADRLSQSGLPAGLADYLLEEIEIGIGVNSNNGNRAVEHINTMVDRSDAAVQARRIFDPWVQQQVKSLSDRKVILNKN